MSSDQFETRSRLRPGDVVCAASAHSALECIVCPQCMTCAQTLSMLLFEAAAIIDVFSFSCTAQSKGLQVVGGLRPSTDTSQFVVPVSAAPLRCVVTLRLPTRVTSYCSASCLHFKMWIYAHNGNFWNRLAMR